MNSQQSLPFPPQPNSYTPTTTTTTTTSNHPMISPNPPPTQNPGFPFNTSVPNSTPKPFDYFDGSSSPSSGFGTSGFTIDPTRKKSGRPRQYSPDGGNGNGNGNTTALALAAPTPVSSVGHDAGSGGGSHSSHKRRGRPAGSGKKHLKAFGASGIGFTPHVILVNAGEDIASKIMAFSQQGPRTVCILSATGAICNVTLRQPAMSGGTVTYEGRFEILSLTGSYLLSESNGSRSRTGGLSVSLAGSDGRVFGGCVSGMLMAAIPVQVIVGSFIADDKKSKPSPSPATPSNVFNFGAPVAGTSPPFQGASSESSDDNGDGPLNHGSGPYNNANQPPAQSMPMYTNMGWANQG